jgi:NHLM bacteriocin system ABC transporter ATP-binding protein
MIAQLGTEIFEKQGEHVRVGSNRPILLRGDSAWLVAQGRVDVFLVRTGEDGRVVGRRSHLLRADKGHMMMDVAPSLDTEGVALLAVGASDTELIRIPQAELWSSRASVELGRAVGGLVEGWVELLSCSVCPEVLSERVTDLEAGDVVLLEEGGYVRAESRAVWVRHLAGSSHVAGRHHLRLEGEGLFPLSHRLWIEAEAGTRVHAVDTLRAQRDDEAAAGLNRLHHAVLRLALEQREKAEAEQRERLLRKTTEERESFRHAWSRLAEVGERIRRGVARLRPQPTDADILLAACCQIGDAIGLEIRAPTNLQSTQNSRDPLGAIARASRINIRPVALTEGWWREDAGPLLAWLDDGPVALLPTPGPGYVYDDPAGRKRCKVDAEVAARISPHAYTFYRRFGDDPVDLKGIARFGVRRCRRDVVFFIGVSALTAMLSLVTPIAARTVFNDIIPRAERGYLLQVIVLLLVVSVSSALLSLTGWVALFRIEAKLGGDLMAAVWDRLISLPVRFFRTYSAGNLASRAMAIGSIQEILSAVTISALLTGTMSLVQFGLLFHIHPGLAMWSALLLAATVSVSVVSSYVQLQHQRTIANLQAKISGLVLQLLTHISKLRVAGAEVHAFSLWARSFSEQRRLQYRVRRTGIALRTFNVSFPILANIILFAAMLPLMTGDASLRTGDMIAFLMAFATVSAGMLTVSGQLLNVLSVVPPYEQVKPILSAAPESTLGKHDPGVLHGEIDMEHVTFRYEEDGALVLRDVSFRVRPGEFVALVGPSGSGKSTIIRLLLGFEQPEGGTIYYDGQDLADLDVRAVRSQTGAVLQNAGPLPGDILSNIVGASAATLEEAWEAVRMAGLEEEIQALPMGMNTLIGEGNSTFSGGQRQRLMIARALVRRPRMLFFDEATSALDNQTQAIVTENLNRLQITRVIVAHRLSTIMKADRIYLIAGGRIVQSGTYAELLEVEGPFADLAKRQMI